MRSDGQLYKKTECTPPPLMDCDLPCETPPVTVEKGGIDAQQLLIVGLIFLLVTDKCKKDIPLLLALLYILM
ncbi:MAG: hypothetical protein IJ408_00995 [Clostridia bacterium]|nr:hypothetical protein [Clostridia bacterium]